MTSVASTTGHASATPTSFFSLTSQTSDLDVWTHKEESLRFPLGEDFEFEGTFAHASTLPQAPNPGLTIDGLGGVGLPLSKRDFLLIKARCIQAPYGHGKRILFDKDVRNTWAEFIQGSVVNMVCDNLQGYRLKAPPRCELHKLLLHEPGSHTETVDGVFATIVIILPSQYTGGQFHVSHAGSSKVFDFATKSAFLASLLTWYTDVTYEAMPITSGYQLALPYNLIHASSGLPPSLSDLHDAVSQLRHPLESWSYRFQHPQLRHGVPKYLVCLLDHEFSHANPRGDALKGSDAHKVAQLVPLCAFTSVLGV
ncbi:hypothetical protein JAAARDRAFT_685458 [Jaapia argillacea MUCL 33604]|uniref:Uncharacterized protein n=1 Tax=Jaapia argillacea MUCL 33604 TaxID=933084 RepID=A0A067PSW2_9AGAM|nr:hypothetical protein JAAARDRAFT_685458 [Jaapia argillacea MUCL 33604]